MTDPALGSHFERLLTLQGHDTRVDQLVHRRKVLPEREDLAAAETSLADLERQASAIQDKLDAVARDQRRREDEVAAVEAKLAEITDSMYGGTITSPRELLTMQQEIDALRRRRTAVEDEILELMEYAEPLQGEIAELGEQRDVLDTAARTAIAKIAEQEAVIDDEVGSVRAERELLASTIPQGVVEMYEGLRRSYSGVAVARLENGTCGGCYLALPSAELARIRRLPADEVVHCEECGRLLVH